MSHDTKACKSVAALTSAEITASAASRFKRNIESTAASNTSLTALPFFKAVVTTPVPKGFVRTNTSPGLEVEFWIWAPGSTVPTTESPYFGSSSSTVCPPTMIAPASATFDAPPRNISERTSGRQTTWKRDDVQRRHWTPTNRIHVRHRVDGRYRSVGKSVINNRSEEVHSENQSDAIVQTVDGSIVTVFEADQQIRVRRGSVD